MSPEYQAVEQAVGKIGNWSAAAKLLGYKTAWGLQKQAEKLPPEKVLALCGACSWQVTPHELRPDIYPNPTDGLPADDPRREPVKVAA